MTGKKHNILVNRSATYYSLGDISTAKTLWFVFHGYGMLAQYFIKKFEPIVDDSTCVIAPEGLSKFYVNGFPGKVGASWMTKDGREDEIKDYIQYLNQLYTSVISKVTPDIKVNLVGFSQGGATVSRWVENGNISFSNLILWSSVFPEDINFESIPTTVNTFILRGDNDQFATEQYVLDQKKIVDNSSLKYKFIEFKGGHNIPKEVLIRETKRNNW